MTHTHYIAALFEIEKPTTSGWFSFGFSKSENFQEYYWCAEEQQLYRYNCHTKVKVTPYHWLKPCTETGAVESDAVDFITWYSDQMNTEEGREVLERKSYKQAYEIFKSETQKT